MASLRRIAAPLALAVAAAGVACGDLTGPQAVLSTLSDTVDVFALNGAPPGAPTALYIFAGSMVRADANFAFDVAFDIDPTGKILIIPVRAVASPLSGAHQVGLQTSSTPYNDLLTAPSTGYRNDTTLTVLPNTVVVIQSQNTLACSSSFYGTTTYAKLIVDQVDPVKRVLKTRFTVEPNCGFHSFAPGVPKNPKD